MWGKCRVRQPFRGDAGHLEGHRRGNDVRQKPAADLEPIDLVQIPVGPDRPELQDLVKSRIGPGGLGIAKKRSPS